MYKYIPRFICIRRFSSERDSNKEEFKFGISRPSEVLFQNIQSMENRLEMFNLFRLKRQLDIDFEQLSSMKKSWNPSESSFCFETRVSVFPGLKQPVQSDCNRVQVSFKVSELGLNSSEQHKLKLLCMQRYHPRTDIVKITSNRFPFKEQNEQYLRDVLNRLLKESKNSPEEFDDIPLIHKRNECKSHGRIRYRYRGPPPEKWIQSIKS